MNYMSSMKKNDAIEHSKYEARLAFNNLKFYLDRVNNGWLPDEVDIGLNYIKDWIKTSDDEN